MLVETPASQFMKLSVLVEHYFEHKDRDSKIGIIEFLSMHYAKGDVKDADHDRDMQLPFKQYNPTTLIFTFFNNPTLLLKDKVFPPSVIKQLPLYRSPFHTSESSSNIWQPPKI
jgi:hypothetical protein